MRKVPVMLMMLVLFATVCVSAEENCEEKSDGIHSLEDLKNAINSPSYMRAIVNMNTWLPELVTTLDWETRMSERFMLLYKIDMHDADDDIFDSLLEESEVIYDQLDSFFQIEAHSKQDSLALKNRLLVIMIKTRTERTFGCLTDPHRMFYLLDTKRSPDYMIKLRHEYAHWAWGRLYGEAPALFNEGVAVYAEIMSGPDADYNQFLNADIDIRDIPPLKEAAFNDVFWRHRGMYTAGGLFVSYLVKRWGWDKLKQFFLLSDYEDPEILAHFEEVYQVSLEQADHDWRNGMRSE